MSKTYKHQSVEQADLTLNSLLDLISEGIWDWNGYTGQVVRSPSWYEMLGYKQGALEENVFSWENITHPDDYLLVMSSFEAYIKGTNTEYNVDYRCKRKNGRYIWINDRGKIIEYKPDGSVGRMIGAHSNINNEKLAELDLVEKNELLSQGTMSLDHSIIKKIEKLTLQNHQLENKVTEIEYLSNIDPLTKASNRKKFELEINKEISRANRYSHPLSFAIFDIDHFKVINDQLGHKAGDILLCEISELVAANIRDIDMLARWGGDEFVIIFPEQSIDLAHKTCEKLRLVIEEQKKSITYAITCSFGVTQFVMNENFDRLFQRVDKLLLKAKNNGRNVTVSI